jgi:hypothetical protein
VGLRAWDQRRKEKSQKNSKYSAIGVRFSRAAGNGPESACLPTEDLARWLICMFQIEDNKVTDYGPCECCGDLSRLASGMVRLDDESYAAYQVHWTTHQVALHGAEFYLILGQWGDGTTATDRIGIALHFFIGPDTYGFTVVDANQTPVASHPLVGRALPRESVIDTPLAEKVFKLVDAIWLGDENIAEVTHSIPASIES